MSKYLFQVLFKLFEQRDFIYFGKCGSAAISIVLCRLFGQALPDLIEIDGSFFSLGTDLPIRGCLLKRDD